MIGLLAIIVSASCIASVKAAGGLFHVEESGESSSQASEVRFMRLDGARILETSSDNYAASSSDWAGDWKSVTVNNGQVEIVKEDCESISRTLASLSSEEQVRIDNTIHRVHDLETVVTNDELVGDIRYSLAGPQKSVRKSKPAIQSLESGGIIAIDYMFDKDYAVFLKALPEQLARIFVFHDVVAFVHKDKRIEMRPIKCLEGDQKRMFDQFALAVATAEEEFIEFEIGKSTLTQHLRTV